MDRVEINSTPVVSFTYSVDGLAADPSPDSATVTITRADGTVLHTNAATTNAPSGVFTYTLSASDTSLLDTLRFDWHIGTQTFTTFVEVAGGFYFTISEALALPELATKSAADIAHGRTLAEQAFEDAAGIAYVPRYEYRTLSAAFGDVLGLPRYPVRAIRSVTETLSLGGSPTTVASSGYTLTPVGVYRPSGWIAGPQNVTVGYEYGKDRPPERVRRAVLVLAKNWLITGPVDDRATGIPAGEAGGVITLSTPGVRGVVFGIPEVDAVLEQYGIDRSAHSIALSPASNSYYRPAWSRW